MGTAIPTNDRWTVVAAPADDCWARDYADVQAGQRALVDVQRDHHERGFELAEVVHGN